MKCKNCGKVVFPDNSTICPNCGKMVTGNDFKRHLRLKGLSMKSILIIIAIGIWLLVLQNLGIISVEQDVCVKNTVDVDVSGNVDVSGSTVNIE